MRARLYIFGSDEPPYKLGCTSDIVRRRPQLMQASQTRVKLGLSPVTEHFSFLNAWEGAFAGAPIGLESNLLRDLKNRRLSFEGRAKNGKRRIYMTEWVDLPLGELVAFVEQHPRSKGLRRVENGMLPKPPKRK